MHTASCPSKRLNELFVLAIREAELKHQRTGRPARTYASAHYAAGTWSAPERVICRVQVSDNGTDVRYIVTSFQEAGAKYLYETAYCGQPLLARTSDMLTALNTS